MKLSFPRLVMSKKGGEPLRDGDQQQILNFVDIHFDTKQNKSGGA